MKETFVELICQRLERNSEELRKRFSQQNGATHARYLVVDDLLPRDLAIDIYNSFPKKEQMRRASTFREAKYTFKQLDEIPTLLKDITFAIQSPRVVSLIEKITKIPRQRPDPSLYAGGLSLMAKGDFLNPHIDNSHDVERKSYRTLNLLYYVTPDWKLEYGGNLELWDKKVEKAVVIPSLFDRLVVMQTNLSAWHSVSPVVFDGQRCCVSNYYFSEVSPEDKEYFHVTSFSARPDQVFHRALSRIDSLVRNGVRKLFRKGVGRNDLYAPKK